MQKKEELSEKESIALKNRNLTKAIAEFHETNHTFHQSMQGFSDVIKGIRNNPKIKLSRKEKKLLDFYLAPYEILKKNPFGEKPPFKTNEENIAFLQQQLKSDAYKDLFIGYEKGVANYSDFLKFFSNLQKKYPKQLGNDAIDSKLTQKGLALGYLKKRDDPSFKIGDSENTSFQADSIKLVQNGPRNVLLLKEIEKNSPTNNFENNIAYIQTRLERVNEGQKFFSKLSDIKDKEQFLKNKIQSAAIFLVKDKTSLFRNLVTTASTTMSIHLDALHPKKNEKLRNVIQKQLDALHQFGEKPDKTNKELLDILTKAVDEIRKAPKNRKGKKEVKMLVENLQEQMEIIKAVETIVIAPPRPKVLNVKSTTPSNATLSKPQDGNPVPPPQSAKPQSVKPVPPPQSSKPTASKQPLTAPPPRPPRLDVPPAAPSNPTTPEQSRYNQCQQARQFFTSLENGARKPFPNRSPTQTSKIDQNEAPPIPPRPKKF